jgi:hypothetical protein
MDMNLLVSLAILLMLAVIAVALLARRRPRAVLQRAAPEVARARSEPVQWPSEAIAPEVVPLAPHEAQRYRMEWHGVQARFAHTPRTAVAEADLLARDVLMRSGCAVAAFQNHASYRAAHAIAQRDLQGDVGIEDLRLAFVHYRKLFDQLLQAGPARRARPEDSRAVKIRGGLLPPERAMASDAQAAGDRER